LPNERIPGALEVRDCPHGRGVFALRDFDADGLIDIVIGGDFVEQPRSSSRYALRIGDRLYWDEVPPDGPSFGATSSIIVMMLTAGLSISTGVFRGPS